MLINSNDDQKLGQLDMVKLQQCEGSEADFHRNILKRKIKGGMKRSCLLSRSTFGVLISAFLGNS